MGLDTEAVARLIRGGETLTVEFKGERRTALPDREIYEVVVCFANADGGVLLIGVEDDGTVSGARPRHGATTEPTRLQAAIFNNTSPPINTRIGVHTADGQSVISIEVDRYPEICATRDGRSLRRVVGVDGPRCIPFLPHEHATRRSDLGLIDYTAQAVDGADWGDLDPLEIEPLRQVAAHRAVRLVIQGGAGSRAFAAFVAEHDLPDTPLGLNELIIVDHLQRERRVDAAAVGRLTQRGEAHARSIL